MWRVTKVWQQVSSLSFQSMINVAGRGKSTMAESPTSTSEKPPIEKLGPLIPDSTLPDPITAHRAVQHQPSVTSQNVPDDEADALREGIDDLMAVGEENGEEMELRNAIEKEICKLTIQQAEIETARKRLEGIGNEEEKNEGTVKIDEFDEDRDRKDAWSAEDENENERSDGETKGDVGGLTGDASAMAGRNNQSSNRRRTSYPMRPDAEDCAFYMKFGSCKFGLNCKFNHPPRRWNQGTKERGNVREENSERTGQTECKYYKTSGGCKYGNNCKYTHGSDKSSTSHIQEFNFLGLPVRPGEKECPYYMRTGSCKYGSSCRFHHPDPIPTTVTGVDSPSGYVNGGSLSSQHVSSASVSSWSSPRAFNDHSSPCAPVMYPPNQGAPSTSNPEWNGYQAAAYPTSEWSLPTPPAFAMNNRPTENIPMRYPHDMVIEEYPQRPGEPECSFFLKTGDCKYRSNCKFHHPKNRISRAKTNSCSLNDKGLPLRPDQPICAHYQRYGICKYGPACKYDHPSNFAISQLPLDPPPFSNSKVVDGA